MHHVKPTPCLSLSGNGTGTAGTMTKSPQPCQVCSGHVAAAGQALQNDQQRISETPCPHPRAMGYRCVCTTGTVRHKAEVQSKSQRGKVFSDMSWAPSRTPLLSFAPPPLGYGNVLGTGLRERRAGQQHKRRLIGGAIGAVRSVGAAATIRVCQGLRSYREAPAPAPVAGAHAGTQGYTPNPRVPCRGGTAVAGQRRQPTYFCPSPSPPEFSLKRGAGGGGGGQDRADWERRPKPPPMSHVHPRFLLPSLTITVTQRPHHLWGEGC